MQKRVKLNGTFRYGCEKGGLAREAPHSVNKKKLIWEKEKKLKTFLYLKGKKNEHVHVGLGYALVNWCMTYIWNRKKTVVTVNLYISLAKNTKVKNCFLYSFIEGRGRNNVTKWHMAREGGLKSDKNESHLNGPLYRKASDENKNFSKSNHKIFQFIP